MLGPPNDLPRSLWLARPRPPEEADAVVVGGGISGLSAAWWLGRLAPAGYRVVVVEAGHLAGRASGRNAGFLLTGSAEPFVTLAAERGRDHALAVWHRSRENRELVRSELLDSGLVDAAFLPEGCWHAALAGSDQEERLAASCEVLSAEGIDCEWRDAAAVRAASGSERLGGAIFLARDGGLDPLLLCRGLAATGGFEVRTGSRVRAIEADGERLRVVAEGGDLVAPRVVVATNAYAAELLPQLAGAWSPRRAQMLATGPGERRLEGVWYMNEGHAYLRQLADGTLLLGGARNVAVDDEVGTLESPTARVQGALDDFLADAFPQLASRPVVHRWAGIMAFTDDGRPRMGEVPGLPGAYVAAGWNGHGMSFGFAAGRHLARQVLGEEVGEFLPTG